MKALTKTSNFAFMCAFYVISLVGIVTVIDKFFLAGILTFPVIIFCVKWFSENSVSFEKRNNNLIWLALQTVSACIMFYMMLKLEVNYSWDWGQLIKTAHNYVLNGQIEYPDYYARYPNNRFWFTVLIALFRCSKLVIPGIQSAGMKMLSMIVSFIFVQVTVFFIYKIACLLWGKNLGMICGITALLCCPLYLYAQFNYTDTPVLMLISIVCYLYIKFKKENIRGSKKEYIYVAVITFVAFLIYEIKVMGVIIYIGILIDYFLSTKSFRQVKRFAVNIVIVVIVFAISFSIAGVFVDKVIPVSEESSEQYEFPLTHWVMMGLGGVGGYDSEDVAYTMSFLTYDEKMDANILRIKERLTEKGVSGLLEHIFITKTARTWGQSTLGGEDYVSRYTISTDSLVYDIFSFEGDLAVIRKAFTGIYHIIMILGILLSYIFAFRRFNDNDNLYFCRIALFGQFLFMTIWECNSRYLLIWVPLLLIVSFEGWYKFIKYKKTGQINLSFGGKNET